MNLPVRFRNAARQEFDEAALWYEERREGLGRQFVIEIERAVNQASETPQRFPFVVDDIQCVRVRRFPYSLFFRVEPERIVILAVFHARRDPQLWRGRVDL